MDTISRNRAEALMTTFVNDDGSTIAAEATGTAGGLRVKAEVLKHVFGWELKPEGICKDQVCLPVQRHEGLVEDAGVDLVAFADLLGRPFVFDAECGVAHMGESARARGEQLASLTAPEFTLPDLDGRLHSLSDYRGKRVLLVAHASW
jgi:hypothetical protein